MNRVKEVFKGKDIKQTWLTEKSGKSCNIENSYVQNRQQQRLKTLFEITETLDVKPKNLLNYNK